MRGDAVGVCRWTWFCRGPALPGRPVRLKWNDILYVACRVPAVSLPCASLCLCRVSAVSGLCFCCRFAVLVSCVCLCCALALDFQYLCHEVAVLLPCVGCGSSLCWVVDCSGRDCVRVRLGCPVCDGRVLAMHLPCAFQPGLPAVLLERALDGPVAFEPLQARPQNKSPWCCKTMQ